jgi:hypothetical protein
MRFTSQQQPPKEPVFMQFDDHSRTVPFPCALGASEPMSDYRYAYTTAMRRWVLATLSEHADYNTISEDESLRVCEQQARLLVGSALHANERRLLVEAVRDVIVVREAKARNSEWLSDMQAGGLGEIAS